MKIAVSGISSLIDSNIFLRAFWSELRNRFGKCAWHYQPFKDGSSRTIFLGWANINKERTVSISLSYSQKSIVNGIHFGEQFDETIDESSELGRQLKDAVKTAFDHRHKPSIETFQLPISSLYSSLSPYSGQWFEILPNQHPISLLSIKVRAFDYEDAKTEILRVVSPILDVLSVETNNLFWLYKTEDNQVNISKAELGEMLYPEVNNFVTDEKWMDEIPINNGYLLLSSQAIQFIDRILSKDELSSAEDAFISSCHHYHIARSQDALIYNRLFSCGKQENEDGSVEFHLQEDSRLKTASMFSRRAEEIATVLYMSAIEVASTIDSNPPKKCSNCGQEQYKISARVVDYVTKYLGLKEGHHLSKVFKSHYEKRSKYLHAGVMLTDNSYTGTTIPRLDPSSDSGVSQRTSVLLANLREWIGYMLRQQLKTM